MEEYILLKYENCVKMKMELEITAQFSVYEEEIQLMGTSKNLFFRGGVWGKAP